MKTKIHIKVYRDIEGKRMLAFYILNQEFILTAPEAIELIQKIEEKL